MQETNINELEKLIGSDKMVRARVSYYYGEASGWHTAVINFENTIQNIASCIYLDSACEVEVYDSEDQLRLYAVKGKIDAANSESLLAQQVNGYLRKIVRGEVPVHDFEYIDEGENIDHCFSNPHGDMQL